MTNIVTLHFPRTSYRIIIEAKTSLNFNAIDDVSRIEADILGSRLSLSNGKDRLERIFPPPIYHPKFRPVLSFFSSFLISGVAFGGSILDMCVAGILGVLIVWVMDKEKKPYYSPSPIEFFLAFISSVAARGLSCIKGEFFCYTAITSGAIISLLPTSVFRTFNQ